MKRLIISIAALLLNALIISPAHSFSVFGAAGIESKDISAFKKWVRVLKRQPRRIERLNHVCEADTSCPEESWQDFLQRLKTLSHEKQLTEANHYLNQSPYVQDIINWGVEDYWETLPEFFEMSGDCEDYAMAKYFALKHVGFAENDLRIVVLQDKNLGVLHAVLAVHLNGSTYILDNQIADVLKDSRIHHYSPYYSINTTAWWRHVSE